MGKADTDLGSIEPEKAHLVLVAGNPVSNLSDIRRSTVVVNTTPSSYIKRLGLKARDRRV
jgi:hypothetical protein